MSLKAALQRPLGVPMGPPWGPQDPLRLRSAASAGFLFKHLYFELKKVKRKVEIEGLDPSRKIRSEILRHFPVRMSKMDLWRPIW